MSLTTKSSQYTLSKHIYHAEQLPNKYFFKKGFSSSKQIPYDFTMYIFPCLQSITFNLFLLFVQILHIFVVSALKVLSRFKVISHKVWSWKTMPETIIIRNTCLSDRQLAAQSAPFFEFCFVWWQSIWIECIRATKVVSDTKDSLFYMFCPMHSHRY